MVRVDRFFPRLTSAAEKGAQALRICDKFCICHLATGDMPREQVMKEIPFSVEAKWIIDPGRLVSDDISW